MDASTSSSPLHIGLVTPAWPGHKTPNGIATAVAHLAAGLESCGHKVTIITFAIDAEHDSARVITVPPPRWTMLDRIRIRLSLGAEGVVHRSVARAIAAAAQTAIIDHGIEALIVEETQGWTSTIRSHVQIPVVVTLHGPWWLHKDFQLPESAGADSQRELREANGIKAASAILSPSADVLKRTQEYWGLPSVPLAVLPNPVPIEAETPPFDPSLLERILFVGRFDLVKGGDVVLEAFAEIARRHPSCRLTFAGPDRGIPRPGQPPLTLPEALSRLPEDVRTRVDVLGQCSRDEVAALRLTHGLTIVASRYETFGGTMAEALAAGSALVCTRVGGCAENVVDEETGLLVPPEDPQALAAACLRLLDDPVLARNMGVAAREYVKTHLSPAEIGRQMADFLRPLCRR